MEKITVRDLVEVTDRFTPKNTGVERVRIFNAVVMSIEKRYDDDGRLFWYITYEPVDILTCGLFGACRVYDDDNGQRYGRTSMKVLGHDSLTSGEKWNRQFRGPRPGDRAYDLMC